jgi:hypothetical protein
MALRRGEPVLLTERRRALLALAAEFADPDNLARLRAVADRPLHIVLTRRRVIALGFARRDADRGALSGAVSLALSSTLTA